MNKNHGVFVRHPKAPIWDGETVHNNPNLARVLSITQEELDKFPPKTVFNYSDTIFCSCCGSHYATRMSGDGRFLRNQGIAVYLGDSGIASHDDEESSRAVIQTKNGPVTVEVLKSI